MLLSARLPGGAGRNAHDAFALVREQRIYPANSHDKFAFVYGDVLSCRGSGTYRLIPTRGRRGILGARDAVSESTGATVVDKSVDDLRGTSERESGGAFPPRAGLMEPSVCGRACDLHRHDNQGHRPRFD